METEKKAATITVCMDLHEASDLKDEIFEVKSSVDFIPFIDKCPRLWELLAGINGILNNVKTSENAKI